MRPWRTLLLLSVAAIGLCCASCDSTEPLSDPAQAGLDARLIGLWRNQADNGDDVYCRIAPGTHLPKGVFRGLWVAENADKLSSRLVECIVFPTNIDGNTYLNVGLFGKGQAEKLADSEFKPEMIQSYLLVQYQFQNDVLVIRGMDDAAKKKAIATGKVRGTTDESGYTWFTDTPERLTALVTVEAASLFPQVTARCQRLK